MALIAQVCYNTIYTRYGVQVVSLCYIKIQMLMSVIANHLHAVNSAIILMDHSFAIAMMGII